MTGSQRIYQDIDLGSVDGQLITVMDRDRNYYELDVGSITFICGTLEQAFALATEIRKCVAIEV
jgi:hypothetical protein